MTVPTRQCPGQTPREKKPQMPRADGPTSTNHLPTVAEKHTGSGLGATRETPIREI
jgi:hypothetical protein